MMSFISKLFILAAITMGAGFSFAEVPEDDRPKRKPPKIRTIDELEKIRSKNIKKTKGDVEGVLKFRSSDFDQQYFIGGKVQNYAESLTDRLIEGLKDVFPDLYSNLVNQVNVYVVYDRTLNAHATRNNNILLTSQWLKDAQSEGEIAAVLAHELSHIILVHPDTNVDRKQQQKSLEKFVHVASLVTMLANMKSKSSGNHTQLYYSESGKKEMAKAMLLGNLMNDIKLHYLNTRVSRKNEEQADYLAVDLMEMSDFPTGMSRQMLALLYDDESKNEEAMIAAESYLDLVGPIFQKWLADELKKIAGNNVLKLALALGVQNYGAKIANKVSHWFKEKRRTHLRAKTRYFRVDDYLDEYDLDESPPSNTNDFASIKQTVTSLYNEFELLELANNYIDIGQYKNADNTIRKVSNSIRSKNKKLYQPVNIKMWVMRSKLRIAQLRYKDAIENLCYYTMKFKSKDCHDQDLSLQAEKIGIHIPQDLFVLLAESYVHLGENDKAHHVIEQGTRYADEQPFHLHNVMLACQEKNYATFYSSLKQCKDSTGFNAAKYCGMIESHIEALKEAEQEKLREAKSFSFTGIKYEKLDWWTSCNQVTGRPFSTVKTNTEVEEIKKSADKLTEEHNDRIKKEASASEKITKA